MDQDTQPAPFNLGDHLCYVGPQQRRELPVGRQGCTELVLTHGMVGVIILSSGDLAGQDGTAPKPWRCQAQFRNGFQLNITPQNRFAFKAAGRKGFVDPKSALPGPT